MLQWTKNHKLITLGLGLTLIVLMIANIWLFGSNFLLNSSLVSEEKLFEYNQTLSQTAEEASELASRNAEKPLTAEQVDQAIHPLLRQTDQIIAHLQTADYPTSLKAEVDATLELAEVLSFTLNSYKLKPTSELSSAHISQVFRQAAINAANLSDGQQ